MNQKKTLYEITHQCLIVLNYIRKSSATGFIPNEARKPENHAQVKLNLEANRNNTIKYPPVEVGRLVRLYCKRKNCETRLNPFGVRRNMKLNRLKTCLM